MNKLNFEDSRWWEFSLNFKWPHQGFNIGYDFFQPTKQDPAYELYFYLGLISLVFHWGDDNWVFDEE